MKQLAFILILLFLKNIAFSQNQDFPEKIIGDWKGNYQQLNGTFKAWPMQLQIKYAASTDKYYWKIMYNDESRPFNILMPVNKNQGHWSIDEKNGNVFHLYVHHNSFQIAYTTDGMTRLENYKFENNKIFIEYFEFSTTHKKQSGLGTREIPFIDSYMVGGYHIATLEKIK